jgi:Holliday junction resolvase RusA-like endonuclease
MRFVIFGEPQGKARPRFSTRSGVPRTYTSQKTVDYEEKVREAFEETGHPGYHDKEPVLVHIDAYFKIPKSTSKIKRQLMLEKTSPVKKPDADNIAKIICDALNGYAYDDDSQVAFLAVSKFWAKEEPYVEVEIWAGEE